MKRLGEELRSRGDAVGYVSFLSALVHHGVLVEGLAAIQVASRDRAGPWEEGLVEYVLLPRDLWFGYRDEPFEGETVPVATPEKALLDWCWLAEEQGLDPRLDEMDWSALDLGALDALAAQTGLSYRRLLPPADASKYEQAQQRAEAIARLR